jgi:hypothetical protein
MAKYNMKIYQNILLLLVLMIVSDNIKSEKEIFVCQKGEMKASWYTMGQDEVALNVNGLKPGFVILVDTTLKAKNFISFHDSYCRKQSIELDTSDLTWTDGWKNLTTKQKFERVNQEKKEYLIEADSQRILNNQGQQQVWIINNSNNTVSIQMQDWSFICVLQALTKSGKWYPIEYWRFSECGNSYHLKYFPPRMANSFVTILPNYGDYKTKFRYKLLGKDKFYYSNEFEGSINHCEFIENNRSINYPGETLPINFKLERFIEMAYR